MNRVYRVYNSYDHVCVALDSDGEHIYNTGEHIIIDGEWHTIKKSEHSYDFVIDINIRYRVCGDGHIEFENL